MTTDMGRSNGDKPSVLHSVADMLTRQVTTDQLLDSMVDLVVEEVGAERGTLYLVDGLTGELCSRVAHLPEMKEIRLPPGQGVAGHVAESGDISNLEDVGADDHFFDGIDQVTGFQTRNMLTVPVRDDRAVRGVLQLLNREGGFSTEQEELLLDLAEQVVQALERTSMRPCGDLSRGVLVDGPFNNIVGESSPMVDLYDRITVAASADVTVLVRGATGTGKTLVAHAVHDNSPRRDGPFVHVDCTVLPAGLIESELFGHEQGAFTGASRRVQGKFELAHGGTLFLDEIGDLPLPLQSKLLRFLQEREFERLGGRETLRADVRVISATNADLEEQISEGKFRSDLYYRIKVLDLVVPSLAERGSADIERLSEHFLDVYTRRHRRRNSGIGAEALVRLQRHGWPGNVRELEHCIESAVVLAMGRPIGLEHLALPGTSEQAAPVAGYPPGTPLAEVELDHIKRTLEACGDNRTEAARQLGIGRNTLLRKLK